MGKKIALLLLSWTALLFLLNKLSFYALPDVSSYELPAKLAVPFRFWVVPFLNFDGRNYLTIVLSGYSQIQNTNHMDLRVFFPLYPLLIRIFSLNLLINPIIVGLIISTASFIGGIVLLCYFARKLKISESKTVLSLLLFPVSFYFVTYYTESLFLFLTLVTFYFLSKKKILYASCMVALATATRITGLALFPVLIWEAYVKYKETKKIAWEIFIGLLGIVIYMAYLQITTGDALLFLHGHDTWKKPYGLLGPFYAILNGLVQSVFGVQTSNPYSHFIVILEFITIFSLILVTILSFKKLPRSQWIYMACSVALILLSGVLFSVMRYALVIFPLYLYIGSIRSKAVFITLMISFAILLIILSSLFFRNYWVA